ncbi:MAG TPA: hypothetical protein VG939_13085, partial [Caulobacteraceae bacterium]|nr:hypothetical protein [Caulobacteraceae bacterium]
MKKQLLTALAAATMLASGAAGAQPMQGGDHGRGDRGHSEGLDRRGCYAGERGYDCNQRRAVERRSHHHYVWRDGRYQDDSGAAVAGGVLG